MPSSRGCGVVLRGLCVCMVVVILVVVLAVRERCKDQAPVYQYQREVVLFGEVRGRERKLRLIVVEDRRNTSRTFSSTYGVFPGCCAWRIAQMCEMNDDGWPF
jgi:hypothetical protein